MANGMAGDWDYYADAAENTSEDSDTNDSMPALEDIPTQETRPAAAPTPPPQQNRNPRAAMVEEDEEDEEEEEQQSTDPETNLGRAVLRRVDSDEADEAAIAFDGVAAHPARPTDTLLSNGLLQAGARMTLNRHPSPSTAPHTAPNTTATTATAPPAPSISEAEAQPGPEADPQRLQRWLLTTGLSELQSDSSHAKMSLYVRRMKMLRKQQQEWILNMIGQRGGGKDVKEIVERVRRELES